MVISFLRVWTDGDRQTDTVLESSYGNMSAHKKFKLKTSGELLIFICLLSETHKTVKHTKKFNLIPKIKS